MSSLSISKKQLNRLGERLAAAEEPAQDDVDLLNSVLLEYQQILDEVNGELVRLELTATSRVKTLDVLIDKLKRERTRHGGSMQLARVQDIAGARIVIDGSRRDQDRIVKVLEDHFTQGGEGPKVLDRRENPSHGYRAVHVVAAWESIPVEIQVRTELQDLWAQLIESLGRVWGRGIRYGEPPEHPQRRVGPFSHRGRQTTRQNFLVQMFKASEYLAKIEELELVIIDAIDAVDSAESPAQFPADDDVGLYRRYYEGRRLFKRVIRSWVDDERAAGRAIRRLLPARIELTSSLAEEIFARCIAWLTNQIDRKRLDQEHLRGQLRAMLMYLHKRVEVGSLR